MYDITAFTSVRGSHGWMGNMAPFSIQHAGSVWRTSEALFQALRFDHPIIKEKIRAEKSPMAAKFLAKRNMSRMVVVPQGEQDLANMAMVLRIKLEQHAELRKKLLATGESQIVEDSTRRPRGSGLFWGAALKDGGWFGANRLGKLWMMLRDELRSN